MNKRDIVFQCEIQNRTFSAIVNYRGLSIFELDNPLSHAAEIGNAIIAYLEPKPHHRFKRGYHLCRYDDEQEIDLTQFSLNDIVVFAEQFGIPIEAENEWFTGAYLNYFVGSPCQRAAQEWVNKHPRLAKQSSCHVDQLTLEDYAKATIYPSNTELKPASRLLAGR
ncbi:hypothetical protein I7Z51_002500 [Vibrio parahaemolyticus]|uniref:hypothetical protein n=1 Tax=Vibrio TaxID=662 RepID=UPI001A8CB8CE|nr:MULTISPECIES: hypothetical protein [Vibrio]EGQ7973577.1 hypothetical protein [Vibrio parahaemolyticus]MBO0209784.1 hypothetical protein [Vibrio sp. Vb0877]MCR9811846.1 hypothetical protein [Vibrio parahaemolyticus]MDW2320294.1 hypothetical protein [Vibrio sp. 1159]